MKENICSIPINDVFMPKDSCPMCRMRDMLEKQKAEYITGSAMMEPNVRIMTNEQGFCHRHFSMMVKLGKRLSNALILESHLKQISEEMLPTNPHGKPDKKKLEAIDRLTKDCFICRQLNENMENMVRIVHAMWQTEPEFRQLYAEQKFICLEHFSLLMNVDRKGLGKNFQAFYEATSKLTGGYLEELCEDVSHFCKMFDYRNADGDWGNSKDSIERSIEFLTGDKVIFDTTEEPEN
ncbi:MAG: DUF6062 family protein [Clostridia bacterium]|nr:DUF6062 family protein [Clostridia bacterium]